VGCRQVNVAADDAGTEVRGNYVKSRESGCVQFVVRSGVRYTCRFTCTNKHSIQSQTEQDLLKVIWEERVATLAVENALARFVCNVHYGRVQSFSRGYATSTSQCHMRIIRYTARCPIPPPV